MFRRIVVCACLGLAISPAGLANVKSELVTLGLTLPVATVQDPTNPAVQFVVQQRGRVKVVLNGIIQTTDFLNLVGTVSSTGGERGLLGLAFDPDYAANGFFYVNYTALPNHATKIVRYQRSANPLVANAASAFNILTIPQPFEFHNGGTLRFGPDGYLYIGMGDGGGALDPNNQAQTLSGSLLGKMLRLDIRSDQFPNDAARNYAIPLSNPFVGDDAEGEIWSCGFRNPFKFSFDNPLWLGSGGLLMGDVGENLWEELNYEPPLAGGRNYGWRVLEGNHPTGRDGANGLPFTSPIWEYPHTVGQSVIGGHVYRGTKLTGHFGRYIFADFVAAKVWSAKLTIGENGEAVPMVAGDLEEITASLALPAGQHISSLDIDSSGELFVTMYEGRYYRIVPDNLIWMTDLTPSFYTTFEGGLRHTLAADGQRIVISEQQFVDLVEKMPAELTFGFTSDSSTSSTFSATLDVKTTEPFGSVFEVQLKNWQTGQFELVDSRQLSPTTPTYTVSGLLASKYRRGSDRRFELRVRSLPIASPVTDPYEVYIDRIVLSPN